MRRQRGGDSQTELFGTPSHVERLDPRTMLGAATRVERLWRVRIGDGGGTHLVFQDRHGTYCEEHGRPCRAVGLVDDRVR